MSTSSSSTFTYSMIARLENLPLLRKFITDNDRIPESLKKMLFLAAEEIFVNICSYAYEDQNGMVELKMELSEKLVLTFSDSGKRFNPLKHTTDITHYDMDRQIGGLGIFLAFEIADHVEYNYIDHKNVLTLTKFL